MCMCVLLCCRNSLLELLLFHSDYLFFVVSLFSRCRFGRKPIFFIGLGIQSLSTMIQIFSPAWTIFSIFFFLTGVGRASNYLCAFVLGKYDLFSSYKHVVLWFDYHVFYVTHRDILLHTPFSFMFLCSLWNPNWQSTGPVHIFWYMWKLGVTCCSLSLLTL